MLLSFWNEIKDYWSEVMAKPNDSRQVSNNNEKCNKIKEREKKCDFNPKHLVQNTFFEQGPKPIEPKISSP